jgi:hypothetical protein
MELGFLLKLEIAGIAIFTQFTTLYCGSDGTAGFMLMAAIRLAAM